MRKARTFLGYLYRHHFIRYLLVGGTTFVLDFSLLVLLHGILNINLVVATSIAYWTSIVYNFTLNRNWTFSAAEKKSLHRHAILYAILLGLNYLFTVVFVSVVSHYFNYGVAKILAVIIQASWTFPIYKYIIFVKKEHTGTT